MTTAREVHANRVSSADELLGSIAADLTILTTPDSQAPPTGQRSVPLGPVQSRMALKLVGTILLVEGIDGPRYVPGVELCLDSSGICVSTAGTSTPRTLGWESVRSVSAERWSGSNPKADTTTVPRPTAPSEQPPGAAPGVAITVTTASAVYRFLVPHVAPEEIGPRIAHLAEGYKSATTSPAQPPPSALGEPAPLGEPSAGPTTATFDRLRPVLTVALILLVASAITLILLQSAGVIHWSFLGGNGGTLGR